MTIGTRQRDPWLLTVRDAYRLRYQPLQGGSATVEYPPPGAQIDYVLPSTPRGPVSIEIVDAAGTIIRKATSDAAPPSRSTDEPSDEMGGPARGRAAPIPLTTRVGLNRWTWDLRHDAPGGARGASPPRGPLAVPGTYTVRMSADGWSATQPLTLKIDPRVAAAGVTQADLEEQLRLQLDVLSAIGEAQRAAARLADARERLREAAGYGSALNAIETLQDQLVTDTGVYPQRMLIDQLSNVYRMISQADQKVGRDAFERYGDLRKELDEVLAQVEKAVGK